MELRFVNGAAQFHTNYLYIYSVQKTEGKRGEKKHTNIFQKGIFKACLNRKPFLNLTEFSHLSQYPKEMGPCM